MLMICTHGIVRTSCCPKLAAAAVQRSHDDSKLQGVVTRAFQCTGHSLQHSWKHHSVGEPALVARTPSYILLDPRKFPSPLSTTHTAAPLFSLQGSLGALIFAERLQHTWMLGVLLIVLGVACISMAGKAPAASTPAVPCSAQRKGKAD